MTVQAQAVANVRRIANTNYAVRTVSFAYCFLVVGLLFWERMAGALAWSLLALQFLVYPQLAFLHARVAKDARQAEIRNLYFDSLALGAWVAMLGFPTWLAYAALFSTTLNSAIVRGWAGAGCAAVCFSFGALAWVVPMGFVHAPGTSDLVSALCFFGSLAYSAGVGLVVQNQNRRLRSAREALREGERRYRLITEHAGDLVAMVDRDGRWLYSSPSYSRILSAADLVAGGDAFRNLHEEDQFRVRGAVQVVVRSGETCRLRLRLHTLSGVVRRFEAMMHAVRDEDGAITGAVMASRDVTELRDRDEQLEIAAHAFERMTEAIVVASASGRILTVNQSYTRITGYAAEEVLGRHESDFRGALQPQVFYDDLYAEVLRNGRWEGTSWCRRRDGTLYREWRSVSAVRDSEERVTHYVSLFRELDNRNTAFPEQPAVGF